MEDRYDRRRSKDGEYYFVLKAGNNEIIAVSETYTSSSARENGIAAVKVYATEAPLDE